MRHLSPTIVVLVLALPLSLPAVAADDLSAECRGVAAAVAATMRAADEIIGDDQSRVAVIAARRACTAAREGLTATNVPIGDEKTNKIAATSVETPEVPEAAEEEKNIWDFLNRKANRKPGNERLRRLKTQ